MFLDLPETDSALFERIRIRDLSMPIYLNKVLSIKTKKKRIFIGILKVTDEKSRIRIQIRKVVVYGSTTVPKCHGSTKVNLFELQYRYRFLDSVSNSDPELGPEGSSKVLGTEK